MAIDKLGQNAIADGSVDTAQLADDSVNSAKIGVDVIAAEDLAANSVTVSEISNGAVTLDKLSATGTKDGTTFLRGDNTFATPPTPTLSSLSIDNHDQITVNADGVMSVSATPAFYVVNTNTNFSSTTAAKWGANLAVTNNGSHFDLTNDRFVAPVAGIYSFHWHSLVRNASSGVRIAWYKNGTKVTDSSNANYSDIYAQDSGEMNVAMNGIFSLNANDYIEVYYWLPTGDLYGSSNGHNGWTGFKLA